MTKLQENTHLVFSQNQELFARLKLRFKKIYELKPHYRIDGLCLALSVQVLIEQRQHGLSGGAGYLSWLQSLSNSDHPRSLSITPETSIEDLEKILRNRFRHQHLSTVLESLIRLHASQNLERESLALINDMIRHLTMKNQGCLSCLPAKSPKRLLTTKTSQTLETINRKLSDAEEDYGINIKNNGLIIVNPAGANAAAKQRKLPMSSLTKQRYVDFMASLRRVDQNQYFMLVTRNHAMAIAYQRTKNRGQWSFFDPNKGIYVYDDFNELESFMDDYFFADFKTSDLKYEFLESQIKDNAFIRYTRFSEIDTEHYDGIWKNFPQHEELYIINALINEKINLSFNKNITARLLGHTLNEGHITSIRVELIDRFNYHGKTLDAPFSRFSDLKAAILRRTDRNGYLVLNDLNESNLLNDLAPAPDLAERLQQAMKVIRKISSGELHFDFIGRDTGLYSLLTEFFHDENQFLDRREVIKTSFNLLCREKWQQKAENLLKVAKINQEFLKNLTGHEALNKVHFWSEFQAKNAFSLLELKMTKHSDLAKIHINIVPHSIYIGDIQNGFNIFADVQKRSDTVEYARLLGLIWLKARQESDEAVDLFLQGLLDYSLLSDPELYNRFTQAEKQRFNELNALFQTFKKQAYSKTSPFFTDLESSNLPREVGCYFLSSKKHCLVLKIIQDNGQYQSTVYDPNIGEISVKTNSAERSQGTLREILYDYLNEKVYKEYTRRAIYGFSQPHFEDSFDVKKINMNLLKNSDLFQDFQQRLSGIRLQKIANDAQGNYGNTRLSPTVFEKMGGFFFPQNPSISPTSSATALIPSSHHSRKVNIKDLRFEADTLNRYLLKKNQNNSIGSLESIKLLKERINMAKRSGKSNESFLTGSPWQKKTASALLDIINASSDLCVPSFKNRLLSRLSSKKTDNRLNRANNLMQSYGYINGFSGLIKSHKALQKSDNLKTEEKNALIFEYHLALAQLTSNIGIDTTQYGLSNLGRHLQRIPPHLVRKYSSLKKIGFKAGKKLARFGAPFLSILSAGSDIYHAWKAFDQLSDTTDPETRHDLIVSGVFSVLGASVAVSMGIAFMVGGRAAAVAGPAGLITGIGLIAGNQLYSAVRQMNDIQKHTELSTGEIWQNGWRTFWGLDVTSEVKERHEQAIIQADIRKIYDEKLLEQANHFLNYLSTEKIDTYWYSRGDFTLTKSPYKKIVQPEALPYPPRLTPELSPRILEDKIHPDHVADKLQQYAHLNTKVTDSEYCDFKPSSLFAVDDICDVSNSEANSSSVQKVSSSIVKRYNSALFDFGDGNDTATGYQDKKNIFRVGNGLKKYTGGKYVDAFYLYSSTVSSGPSDFNGFHGEDIVIADHDLAGTDYDGYSINLETTKVHYRSSDGTYILLANLNDIEHAYGHKKTQDELIGNYEDNVLNGAGGKDVIWGNGGTDTLVLEEGDAHGGEGVDNYIILKNGQDHPVQVNIYDNDKKGEISFISLPSGILFFSLVKDKVTADQYHIQITSDSSYEYIPRTTVFIKEAYHAKNNDTLVLNGQYLFSTGDGLLLFPDWPETIKKEEFQFPFIPQFYAQYSVIHDLKHQAYFKNRLKNNICISLEKRESKNDIIIVGQDAIPLAAKVELQLIDTPFNDRLKGNCRDNLIVSSRGNDYLEGGAGQDLYHIRQPEDENKSRTVRINNKDTAPYPSYDLLTLPVPLSQVSVIEVIGQDIVLSSEQEPDKNLKIHFEHFLLDESYRHINILDINGQLFELNVDEHNQAYLGHPAGSLSPTERADILLITDGDILQNRELNAQGGRDVIIDKSNYDYTLRGGGSHDIIIALENGHKKLYGDEGNDKLFSGPGDDDLTGGEGNDCLSGGEGDDQYFVSRLDGHTTIEDSAGIDTLVLPDISADELCFKKIDKDIYITLTDPSLKKFFSIKLKEGDSVPEKKIEKIQMKDGEFVLKELLLSVVSFTTEEKQQLISYHNEFMFSENMVQITGGH